MKKLKKKKNRVNSIEAYGCRCPFSFCSCACGNPSCPCSVTTRLSTALSHEEQGRVRNTVTNRLVGQAVHILRR